MLELSNMKVIDVKNLKKTYLVHQKEPGLFGTFKSLIRRKYQKVKAVDGISFEITQGELIGFIGSNGAGKTTTLKCLSGLLYPTSGEISVLGFKPWERKHQFLKQIAFIMGQKNQLWWDLPPMDTFLLNKEIYEISDATFKKTLNGLIDLLEVKDILKIQVKKLSLGQRMKCELIANLLHSPKVLFLDEPTIGLDVVMQKKLREFISHYNQRYYSTIILTSHYMKDVERLCRRVIVINHGKIIFDGKLADLVKKYAPYKLIRATLTNNVDREEIENLAEVKTFEYPKVIFKVPSQNVNEIITKITNKLSVEDLNIEDTEIEEVIGKVFGLPKQ